uniref:Uncharacterized protein n=1 Tax=Caenorhabditis japonica TaxID=281687 RepID=A0A8R1IPT8_CAEJA
MYWSLDHPQKSLDHPLGDADSIALRELVAERLKKKKDGPPIPKSFRSTKKAKGKKAWKKNDNTKSESDIFDCNTFTFKIDTNLAPEGENHTSAQ